MKNKIKIKKKRNKSKILLHLSIFTLINNNLCLDYPIKPYTEKRKSKTGKITFHNFFDTV